MRLRLDDIVVRLPGAASPLFAIPALEIPAGAHLLIEGPSGKGKTTFLHLLSGQFLPERGSLEAGDHSVTKMSSEDRCRLRRDHFGILFQRCNLIGHLTALENALLALPHPGPSDRERALKALERLGLSAAAHRPARFLSPGEQQRVALARILARPPDIVLADEPTSNLDTPNALLVMEALSEAARGKTLIVVSHDPRTRGHFGSVSDFANLAAP